ncbi:MAG: hypothetical protein KF749_01475 [Bacteroidetes bacterium]|nr:hypothetical protein [Bacteroidota bacterium]MCW5896184.1 hypothetical protein [Bacteroidota bacterium]
MKQIVFLAFLFVAASSYSQEAAPYPPAPDNVLSVTTLVAKDEPGAKLVITGTAYKADGKTVYPDLVIYLYQTDATGVYNTADGNWQRPRIRGWVKTDDKGRYEIRTIKPGSYPRSRNPAHIHAIVRLPDEKPKWIDDFLFEGDEFLSERDVQRAAKSGTFSNIMKATIDNDGTLRCTRSIVIQ